MIISQDQSSLASEGKGEKAGATFGETLHVLTYHTLVDRNSAVHVCTDACVPVSKTPHHQPTPDRHLSKRCGFLFRLSVIYRDAMYEPHGDREELHFSITNDAFITSSHGQFDKPHLVAFGKRDVGHAVL